MLRHKKREGEGDILKEAQLASILYNRESRRRRSDALRKTQDTQSFKFYPLTIGFQLAPAEPVMDEDTGVMIYDECIGQFRLPSQLGAPELEATDERSMLRRRCILCEDEHSDESSCAQCTNGRYCSKFCRNRDSDAHKKVCGILERLSDDTRPSTNHYRVAYFPPNGEAPSFIWVKALLQRYRKDGAISWAFDQKDVEDWAESKQYMLNTFISPISSHAYLEVPPMGQGIALLGAKGFVDTDHSHTAADINMAVHRLASPGHLTPTFGPLFVVAYRITETGNITSPEDADLRCLRLGIDTLLQNPDNPVLVQLDRCRYIAYPALKYNCPDTEWNKALGIMKEVERVLIPTVPDDEIPVEFLAHPIARAFEVGLRWCIKPVQVPAGLDETIWLDNRSTWSEDDPFLQLITTIGMTSARWVDGVNTSQQRYRADIDFTNVRHWNSVIVHHLYGQNIQIAHVEALMEYVALVRRHNVRGSREGFSAFWAKWKAEQVEKGNLIQHIRSPYELEEELPAGMHANDRIEGMFQWFAVRAGSNDTVIFGTNANATNDVTDD